MVPWTHNTTTVCFRINGPDFKYQNGILSSNLHRRSRRGRLGANWYEKENRSMELGHRTQRPPLLHLVRSSVQGGVALRWAILDRFGSYGTGAMWRARFAYLEVAVVGEGSRWRRPFFLKLGWWCGGSPVYLMWQGKHQQEQWTPSILPRWLARHGRQYNGVVATKTVARVWAQFGWGKLLGMAPYIGKVVPTTRKLCGRQSDAIFVLIQNGFGWRSWGTEGFPSRRQHEFGSVSVLREDNGVLPVPTWATCWPLGHEVGHAKRKRRQSAWALIKVLAHGQ
jgi:hypothetical protein